MSKINIYPVSGREFKAIRSGSGYSAQDVANFLATYAVRQKWNMRFAKTMQTVYQLEAKTWIADKYVEALRALVGEDAFLARLRIYRMKREQSEQRRRELEELKHQKENQ